MHYFRDYPTGTPFPETPHAVSSSLPTMQAIIGYEEKLPEVMSLLKQGYPRFVRHEWIRKLASDVARENNLQAEQVLPVSSVGSARRVCEYAGVPVRVIEKNGYACAVIPQDADIIKRAWAYLQHTGCLVSSRQAEDIFVANGQLPKVFVEETETEDAQGKIIADLRSRSVASSSVYLTRTGMSAGYATLRSAAAIQLKRGRTVWVQLGWLYLDTQRILENLLPAGVSCVKLLNACDMEGLEKELSAIGNDLAGIITEIPTNPLVKSGNIEAIRESVRKRGGVCLFDPTLVSIENLDTLPLADVQILSLTKYTGWNCDVLCGAVMLNKESPFYADFLEELPKWIELPYSRDLGRLAFEMRNWTDVLRSINANTVALAHWLESHPAIKRVHWAYDKDAEYYRKLTNSEEKAGSMLTLELRQPLWDFYDRCHFAKGPSFGVNFMLMCPFMHLAHYDLTNNPAGQATLRSHGIDPDLIRISVGVEPLDAIKAEFERVLRE